MILKAKEKNAVKYVISILKQGGLVIYPTESSYGIGADFNNNEAKKRIYAIKKRAKSKQLSVIAGSLAAIRKYAEIGKDASLLARKFMPGPLTLVVKRKGRGTIAFRISSHPFALALAKRYGKPITATSANIAGKKQLYKISDVIKAFGGKADLIIDGGDLLLSKPSTIYDIARKKLLRKGPVSGKDIRSALKNKNLA